MEKDITSEKPLSLWHNRDYLLLWLGQAVSSLGTGISQLAFPLLILAFTHSPAAAGFALIDSIASILVASYRLTMVPDELQGRVGSVYRLILYGSLTLGLALIGVSLQHFGVLVTVAALWSWLLLFTLLMLVNRQVRQATFPKENM